MAVNATAQKQKIDRMMARITDVEDQSANKNVLGTLYGKTGTGKTTILMGLARRLAGPDGRVLMVDSSDGFVTLEKFPALMPDERFAYRDHGYDLLPTLAGALTLPDEKRPTRLKGIRVVVIDEGSSIAADILDTALRERLGTAEDEIPSEIPEWTDYFPQKEHYRKAMIALHDVPDLHVLVAAHERMYEDKVTKEKFTRPDFPNALLSEIYKNQHFVVRLTNEIKVVAGAAPVIARKLQTLPTARIEAKSRVTDLPYKCEPREFIEAVGAWVEDGLYESDGEYEIQADDVLPESNLVTVIGGDEDETAEADSTD